MTSNLLRVCSFESRRGPEMARLIEKFGGLGTIVPSMKEVPVEDHREAFEFAERLLAGKLDIVIFMTGVGTEALVQTLASRGLDGPVLAKLAESIVIARGPKPVAVLNRWGVRIDLRAPEPNTWQVMAAEIERQGLSLAGKRVAVQEYGIPSTDLYEWLAAQRAEVFPVPIYNWALPDDVEPLRRAIRSTVAGEFDILLWTSAQQVVHACQVAESLGVRADWIEAANRCFIGSIGPTASERLREFGLEPDLEPSHPKMAHLVRESIEAATGRHRDDAST